MLRISSSVALGLVVSVPLLLASADANAEPITAGTIMKNMDARERYTFVSGIVEGLATARYMQDDKKIDGMNCIYDWFYKSPQVAVDIFAAFDRYPEYPPGIVVDVLARKVCN